MSVLFASRLIVDLSICSLDAQRVRMCDMKRSGLIVGCELYDHYGLNIRYLSSGFEYAYSNVINLNRR
jgi:hypothetical protein